MSAIEPSLQISEHKMNDRKILFGNFRVTALRDCNMFVTALGEAGVAAPVIGNDRCAGFNGILNEPAKRFCTTVVHDGETNASGVAPVLPLVETGVRFALTDFNCAGDKNFVMDPNSANGLSGVIV